MSLILDIQKSYLSLVRVDCFFLGFYSSFSQNGGLMDIIIIGTLAGVLGTIAMDLLNYLFARSGLLLRIDVRMIGRMSAGWARGRFRYRHLVAQPVRGALSSQRDLDDGLYTCTADAEKMPSNVAPSHQGISHICADCIL